MAEVMGERHRLGEVLVQRQSAGERAGDLPHLYRMGQPRAEMVASSGTKTCVLCARRRKAVEWMIRSRSRWNSLRVGEADSGKRRPRDAEGSLA